ncbi:MAG: integrase core domain-containing protein, partial [Deltaproteobacteria bacterium]|nr:integrase core domain-containing protein [Deltaproteobacteria bacterium]
DVYKRQRYGYLEARERKTMTTSVEVLRNVVRSYPFKIRTILTDNGIEFTYSLLPKGKRPQEEHPFDQECVREGIEHRLTKFRHPYTNGMVEAFNKKVKNGTVRKYYYETKEEFERHLSYYLMNYNFNTKLRSLSYRSPWEVMEEWYSKRGDLFKVNPRDLIVKWGT